MMSLPLWIWLLFAVAGWLFSHILRMCRLYLLVIDWDQTGRSLVKIHAATVLPSLLMPFKTGEILRLGAFITIGPKKEIAFYAWLLERTFDSAFLLFFIIISVLVGRELEIETLVILYLCGVLITFSVGLIFVRELLPFLIDHSLYASRSARSGRILPILKNVQSSLTRAFKLLRGRWFTLSALTILIWVFEFISLLLFICSLYSVISLPLFESLTQQLEQVNLNSVLGGQQSYKIIGASLLFTISFWFILLSWRRRNV